MNAYISLLDGWVRLVGRGNGKYGEEGDFFYSLVLSPMGQQMVEGSCGQQCSSLVLLHEAS